MSVILSVRLLVPLPAFLWGSPSHPLFLYGWVKYKRLIYNEDEDYDGDDDDNNNDDNNDNVDNNNKE